MTPEGGQGAVAPSSGKNFVSIGEFLTENCVMMHRKIPFILLFSPPVGEPSPRRANPGATPAHDVLSFTIDSIKQRFWLQCHLMYGPNVM